MAGVLEISCSGRVLRIALNRPEKRNALNLELCAGLVAAIDQGAADPAVGAILLTGNGKAFCAGMDLSEAGEAESGEINRLHEELFTIGTRIEKPLIAAVDGAALGGGLGLVANCHVVVATDAATFGLTEIRVGLWPFLIYRSVCAAVGERHAAALALTGRIFGAEEARQIGFVQEIGDHPETVAETIAGYSPRAIQAGLRLVRGTRQTDWETAGALARRLRNEIFAGADFREGLLAFHEKRPPKWPSLEDS